MACDILSEIKELIGAEVPISEEITIKVLEFADTISNGSFKERDKALECGAYSILCNAWAQCCYCGIDNVISPGPGVRPCTEAVLVALNTITSGNPDIIDAVGWQIITQSIDKNVSDLTHVLVLRLIRNVAMQSEGNREVFTWTHGLMLPLISLIITDTPSSALVQEWCAAMKALFLADDPRVDYNRAEERKKLIRQTKVLPVLAGLLSQQEYEEDADALNALVVFLGTMAIKENHLEFIESGNVLPGIDNILRRHIQNMTLALHTISFLRYLCTCPTVRRKCAGYPFMKAVLEAVNIHKTESDLIDVSMSCIAMLTLENGCQTSQFIRLNGLPLTLQIMNDYKTNIPILKGACFTLRNISENGGSDGRSKINGTGFLPLLNELLETNPELTESYLTPILRDFSNDSISDEPSTKQDPPTVADPNSNSPIISEDSPPTLSDDSPTTVLKNLPTVTEESDSISHPSDETPPEVFGETAEDLL